MEGAQWFQGNEMTMKVLFYDDLNVPGDEVGEGAWTLKGS